MNLLPERSAIVSLTFRLWLIIRKLIPRRKCQAFASSNEKYNQHIKRVFVINLDRAPKRWLKMKQELRSILISSGSTLLDLTERFVAVDAKEFIEDPIANVKVDPFYTLSDQLFVEPQPLTLPTQLELETPIRMTRAECAVAQSHINVWEKVAAGENEYALVLEDDVWFDFNFTIKMDNVWNDMLSISDTKTSFDILYLSYLEVKHGAPKTLITRNLFRPDRGLWHLSGYVLSREGAKKLIQLLPIRGPVDLWINHQFKGLDVLASKQSLISQRRDISSSNSYSILPALTTIGAINSEVASLFNISPFEIPVFAFGSEGSGQSSLAMALSMLGYRCCSDFEDLPSCEIKRVFEVKDDRIFSAYVNIGTLYARVWELKSRYPKAKFILTAIENTEEDAELFKIKQSLKGSGLTILYKTELNKWRVVCELLRCAPPSCSYPDLYEVGQRPIFDEKVEYDQGVNFTHPKRDTSPWLIDSNKCWQGINSITEDGLSRNNGENVKIMDSLEFCDTNRWLTRSDTFTDNLALFRPSNVKFEPEIGATFSIKSESLGVREYSSASISSKNQFLYGKFEATIKASNAPGVVTGFFLHRNSPRQEIDIEIAGNRPDRLLVNVFYNPGDIDANYDYGYRGSPSLIDLGFDASKENHKYTIEWNPNEIQWFVDNKLVHRRNIWEPTPIPHLPMTLHANNWITRSTQLAGRINNRNLPTFSIFKNIDIKANINVTEHKVEACKDRAMNLINTQSENIIL